MRVFDLQNRVIPAQMAGCCVIVSDPVDNSGKKTFT